MNQKVNCQVFNILLDGNGNFTNKYSSVVSGNYDFDALLEDYYESKDMGLIQYDSNKQSICFSNSKKAISFFNGRDQEKYYEEVHIHCNSLFDFDNIIKYLQANNYDIHETNTLPHFKEVYKDNFKNYELMISPITDEVSATKNLINILSKKSPELIFRALAIRFGELVDNPNEINNNLIHTLDNIYNKHIAYNKNIVFSENISNKLLAISTNEDSHNLNIVNNIYDMDKNEDTYNI